MDTIAKLLITQHHQGTLKAGNRKRRITVLHIAADRGHAAVVRLLLDHYFDIAATEGMGRTALHLAINAGHADVVKVLISCSADVSAACKSC